MDPSREDVYEAAQVLQENLDKIGCTFSFMGGLGLLLHGLKVDRDIKDIQVVFEEYTVLDDVFAELKAEADDRLVFSAPQDVYTWMITIRPYGDESDIIVDAHVTLTGRKGIEGGIGVLELSVSGEITYEDDKGKQISLTGNVLNIEPMVRTLLWSWDQEDDVTHRQAFMDLHLLMRHEDYSEVIRKVPNDMNLVPRWNFVREVYDRKDRSWKDFGELFNVNPKSEPPSDESSGQEAVFSEGEEHGSLDGTV
ncbi:uncharacterized protein LTHEOB_10422 [Lasiodiplodia theobromae]|uniref:uncharacterized protein n=1 Tax=Lasiodiplodia theobromae TaxID=45133 RepID=UPI0015C40E06|nr:uncharacterized protein LTHEOB_10422 [Lasiodiplodia theobromae]KAF4539258.1 hypothetical protein LTHEOB_10422 [Lasiodiplodia theobromae]